MASFEYNIYRFLRSPKLPADVRRKIFFNLPYKEILTICSEEPEIAIGVCNNENFWYEYTLKDINIKADQFNSVQLPSIFKYGYFYILNASGTDEQNVIMLSGFLVKPEYLVSSSINLGVLPLVKYFDELYNVRRGDKYKNTYRFRQEKSHSIVSALLRRNVPVFKYLFEKYKLFPPVTDPGTSNQTTPIQRWEILAIKLNRPTIFDYLYSIDPSPLDLVYEALIYGVNQDQVKTLIYRTKIVPKSAIIALGNKKWNNVLDFIQETGAKVY